MANDDTVYVISTNHHIYKRIANQWILVPTSDAAIRIVLNNNTPWIINRKKEIYRLVGGKWEKMWEKARELAFGGGQVYRLDTEKVVGGYKIC